MKLNIVEACKLAKNIEMMKRELSSMLLQDSYSCKKTEKHLRSKAAADLTDEVVEVEDKREYELSIEDILAILDNLMDIKATLSSAIEGAKHNITIDVNGKNLSYDSAIEYNKSLRDSVLYSMRYLNRMKKGTSTSQKRGYKMDAEGKQTTYFYDVETTVEFTFDDKETKKKEKAYRKLADEVSMRIDEAKLSNFIEVDIDIEVNDTLEDVINTYLASK